jgi:hypothetical protein
MLIDPTGMLDWHPDGEGGLVADEGDDFLTLMEYSESMGIELSTQEVGVLANQVSSHHESLGENIEGASVELGSGKFNNLVGNFLSKTGVSNSSWGLTHYSGNNCSPTTYRRTRKAMQAVYGTDILGAESWSNNIYRQWQGQDGLYGTGVISNNEYGSLVTQEQIYSGGLKPGALLRLQQTPGPSGSGVSWHAAIFMNYTYDSNNNITGMRYWQQAGSLLNTINFNFDNGGTYSFSRGYKPTLGVNFN